MHSHLSLKGFGIVLSLSSGLGHVGVSENKGYLFFEVLIIGILLFRVLY